MGRKRVMKLAFATAVTLQLVVSTALHAQTAPAQATEGLHTRSLQSVLDDPIAQRCHSLAVTRRRYDTVFQTELERAANLFYIATVFDATAICRQALLAHPGDRTLIIAENNASLALSFVALGVGFPDLDEEGVSQARTNIESKGNPSRIEVQVLAFYLGSAYEYGVGARRDRTEAAKWYAIAAQAGDPISKRELARLQDARP
jgi:hypothetical protein